MYHYKSYRTIFYNKVLEEGYRTMYHNKVLEESTRTMFYNNVIEDFSITMYQYICTYLPPTQFGVWPTQFRYPYRQRNLPTCSAYPSPTQFTSKNIYILIYIYKNIYNFSSPQHPSMHVCLHHMTYISLSWITYPCVFFFLVQ